LPLREAFVNVRGVPEQEASLQHPQPQPPPADALAWFVVHTRPRCEKKVVQYCEREGLDSTLPLVRCVRKYRGKAVTFENPLFPGYVFLRLKQDQQMRVAQSDYVANLLTVVDQDLFSRQLGDILAALNSDVPVQLEPRIGSGSRVRIKTGPLRGMEGWVEQRKGVSVVLLRLDFIGQAAAVRVEATELELL
jgi:transcription antitermination factor NusG